MCDQNLKGEEKDRNQSGLENKRVVKQWEPSGMAEKGFAISTYCVRTPSHWVMGGWVNLK